METEKDRLLEEKDSETRKLSAVCEEIRTVETERDRLLEEKESESRKFRVKICNLESELSLLQTNRDRSRESVVLGNSPTRVSNFAFPQRSGTVADTTGVSNSEVSRCEWLEMFRESERSILDKVSAMIDQRTSNKEMASGTSNLAERCRHSGESRGDSYRRQVQPEQSQDWLKFCKNITPFNPDMSKTAIDEFLAGLKSRIKTRFPPFSNEEKVSILRLSLEGSAQVSLERYPDDVQADFEQLCRQLIRDFGRFPCEDAALAALRGKEGKQLPTERPGEFVRRVERLCSQAYGQAYQGRGDVQLRIAFTEGLLPDIKEKIDALALTNLEEIIAKAEVFYHKGRLDRGVRKEPLQMFQVVKESQPANLELEFAAQANGAEAQDQSGEKAQQKRFKGKCFNCSKFGHRASECKQAKVKSPVNQDFQAFLECMKSLVQQVGGQLESKAQQDSA